MVTDAHSNEVHLVKWPVVIWEVVQFHPQWVQQKLQVEQQLASDGRAFRNIPCVRIAAGNRPIVPRIVLPREDLQVAAANTGNTVLW